MLPLDLVTKYLGRQLWSRIQAGREHTDMPQEVAVTRTALPNLPFCKGITFQLAYSANPVDEIDHRQEAHASAG
jgi:hypothetical protein